MKNLFTFFSLLFTSVLFAQTGYVTGVVTNQQKEPMQGVNVIFNNKGVQTNQQGQYTIEIPANKYTTITYKYVGYKSISKNFRGYKNKTINYSPTLKVKTEEIETVTLKSYEAAQEGVVKLKAENLKEFPEQMLV